MTRVWNVIWSVSKFIGTGYFVLMVGGFYIFGFIHVLVTYFWITASVTILIIVGLMIVVNRLPDPPDHSAEKDDVDDDEWPKAIRVFRTIAGIIFLPFTLAIIPVTLYSFAVEFNLHIACLYAWNYLNTKIPMNDHMVIGIVALIFLFVITNFRQALNEVNTRIGRVARDVDGIKRKR